jgi:hypothetical protein
MAAINVFRADRNSYKKSRQFIFSPPDDWFPGNITTKLPVSEVRQGNADFLPTRKRALAALGKVWKLVKSSFSPGLPPTATRTVFKGLYSVLV